MHAHHTQQLEKNRVAREAREKAELQSDTPDLKSRLVEADEFREQGNYYYRKKQYSEARRCV